MHYSCPSYFWFQCDSCPITNIALFNPVRRGLGWEAEGLCFKPIHIRSCQDTLNPEPSTSQPSPLQTGSSPLEHHRGDLEQGTEPLNAHLGALEELVTHSGTKDKALKMKFTWWTLKFLFKYLCSFLDERGVPSIYMESCRKFKNTDIIMTGIKWMVKTRKMYFQKRCFLSTLLGDNFLGYSRTCNTCVY